MLSSKWPICESSSTADENQPTQHQIADELIFSQRAAPVTEFHMGLTENVEQISQLILVQQASAAL